MSLLVRSVVLGLLGQDSVFLNCWYIITQGMSHENISPSIHSSIDAHPLCIGIYTTLALSLDIERWGRGDLYVVTLIN